MFIVPARAPVAPSNVRSVEAPTAPTAPAPAAGPSSPFATSAFESGTARSVPYFPTNADLQRPTNAFVMNITTGDKQPLNPAQMSTEQGIAFVQQRLQSLGYGGSGTAANTTFPTSGPFRIDYQGDDRQHWDIDGMNVGLTLQLYANNPPDVADRMLAANMQNARRTPPDWGDVAPPPSLIAPPQFQQPAFAPMRMMAGTQFVQPQAQPRTSYFPTREELERPTTAASVNILTGQRTPLNPAQMSTEQGVAFVRERLSALGSTGAGTVSNQTAPSVGPFGIDYGTEDRRHWDIDGMNVGLTLGLYAQYGREVADRMVYDMLHPR